ncbi:MAG: DNA/pantothenate metabolism flavoprotein domain protein [Verrucomicrobia bacterium]|nr:DNA/pantothenate metabolism flavoprotein domain protein [Verrucomicrobiota bacterium]
MNCIVTAGPTYEALDEVRRLTNFSTGKLGTELANFLVARGHDVTLLLGYYSTYRGEQFAQTVRTFSSTAQLADMLREAAGETIGAVFHAAAVSDFKFGKIWKRSPTGELTELQAGKISTRRGTLLAELVPTTKIIAHLRGWYPHARIVGWKYEVDGGRAQVLAKAEQQVAENQINACVANGRAYGPGFGFVTGAGESKHCVDQPALFDTLAEQAGKSGK